MKPRPYVLLSCAMSVDGYLDDSTPARLMLSSDADFDRVDLVRAEQDAILVGAETIRRDNPRLLVRAGHRRQQRLRQGRPASPIKVTLTRSGSLDPGANFFTAGDGARLVYAASPAVARLAELLGDAAEIIDAGDPVDLALVLADLAGRGLERLMVEGGGRTHTQFLVADLADELHLVVAPFFVGDSTAPRFVRDGSFPYNRDRPMALMDVKAIGDVVLLRYRLAGTGHG